MSWRKTGEWWNIFITLIVRSIFIKPAHLFNLNTERKYIIEFNGRTCVAKSARSMLKKQVTSFIHHLFVIPEERGTVPNDSIVKQ